MKILLTLVILSLFGSISCLTQLSACLAECEAEDGFPKLESWQCFQTCTKLYARNCTKEDFKPIADCNNDCHIRESGSYRNFSICQLRCSGKCNIKGFWDIFST